jgi:hypothetical protein
LKGSDKLKKPGTNAAASSRSALAAPDAIALGVILPAVFDGLDVAVERFGPAPPPIRVAPVFALTDGNSVDADVPDGLSVADIAMPNPPPVSPIFLQAVNALSPLVNG